MSFTLAVFCWLLVLLASGAACRALFGQVFGSDRAELERLAAAGGGSVVGEPASIVAAVEEEPVMRSLRTPLLAAALAFYLLGLFLLRLPDHSVSATVTRAKRARRLWGRRRSLVPDEPTKKALKRRDAA